jgi:ABC transport system ATP-binding/permease protein
MFKLVIQDDEGKTTVVPLIRDEITIGRKEGNTIRLTERNVSRRHARILRSNNEVQIEDLGSYNGIRVNNARIAERVSLRISDQVQIGDYKLYLKAEGVEQVDDARTMPIERIENVGTTDVMPVAGTPTAPIPPTPAPARTLGVADTDPAGRPVATAAQITALNPPSGHGKLVVLSSNFAGKEFELTRPQMIVGRTDENDLVVNHRSISRNHAKITRDTDTLRYTISDLQSSNGVRVNGQDYGKVELRRGDVVDLGHVRLRFVEPGEDFVFARDAVIADVEGTGPKKGMMIAIILAVVVIGAVGAFFLLKGKGNEGKQNGSNDGSSGSGDILLVGSAGSAGSAIAMEPIDAAQETGSNSATVPNADDGKKVAAECDAIIAEGHWDTLKMCADKLKPFDAVKAADLAKRALAETGFERKHDDLRTALGEGNLPKARKLLTDIPDSSAYHKDAEDAYNAAEQKAVDDMKGRAQAFAAQNNCKGIDILITQSAAKSQRVVDAVRPFKCAAVAVPVPEDCSQNLRNPDSKDCKKQFCQAHADNARCQPAIVQPACSSETLVETGTQQEARGEHSSALATLEQAYRCKKESHTLQLTFMAACNAGKPAEARKYWKMMSADTQTHVLLICLNNHISREVLDQ